MKISRILGIGAIIVAGAVLPSSANIRITEYMYTGSGGEFVELTNVGASPIDMTGWDYTDNTAPPATIFVDLSLFGVVQPGESVIITQDNATIFRTAWSLPDPWMCSAATPSISAEPMKSTSTTRATHSSIA